MLRSLDDLKRAGWIVRRHGVGTFVADPEQRVPEAPAPPVVTPTHTLAALVVAFGPFYQHCVNLLSAEADTAGLALVCHHARDGTSFRKTRCRSRRCSPADLLIFSYYLLPFAQRLRERGHRVLIVGAPPVGVEPQVPCVTSDQDHGGYEATRHLLDLGHRRLAYVAPDLRYRLDKTLRWNGHQRALGEAARAGLYVHASLVTREAQAAWRGDPSVRRVFAARTRRPGC